jgi:hypothetical protein
VTRIDLTYGQLDKVLRSLGFSSCLVKGEPPARHYKHKETGAFITLPPLPENHRVMEHHFVTVQFTLDGFGIVDANALAAQIQKVG